MQGQVINGFELKRLLGRGGMAEVWYAENEIGKPAAVKILNENLSNSQQIVERFHNEALVMVKLNHPNIRQVYGYGYIGNRHCIIMEYLDGSDLEALLKSGRRFTDEELRKWWNQTVDALNYTHAMDIVHRDIKPSNIFLDNLGNIKLLDYGIAKVRESISMTQTGAMMGTLMYMSPEQVDDAKHLGPKSDIYSLAVTFVHLLTGQVPYDSTSLSDFKIRESIVYKPLDLSGVPIAWQGFLAPYLEKNPEDRPALRHFEEVQPVAEQVRQTVVHVVEEATRVVETPQPEPKPIPKPQPKPTQKPQPKPVESERQTFELDEKPKSKKGLWIGLGIAVVAVAVALFAVPKKKTYKRGFSVSPKECVQFAPGNLRYQPSTNKWCFAGRQWDFIGKDNSKNSPVYKGWIDLFSWGTGDMGRLDSAMPRPEFVDWGSNDIVEIVFWEEKDRYGTKVFYDSASHHRGNGTWRTLTKDEWEYVLNERKTASGERFAAATIIWNDSIWDDVAKGIVLLPDDWNSSVYSLYSTNKNKDVDFNGNKLSIQTWYDTFAPAGAVFLPAAGWLGDDNTYYGPSTGIYWSSTGVGYTGNAYTLNFSTSSGSYIKPSATNAKSGPVSVRLVRPAD